MSAKLLSRIGKASLKSKICKAEDTIPLFKNGMCLGWSGFTPAGYPKAVPIAVADYVEKNKLQGKLRFELFIGASVGAETENRWAKLNMISRRWPYQTGSDIQKGINMNVIDFGDMHLGRFPLCLQAGFYTKDNPRLRGDLDMAIIEASEITEDGGIVPGTGIGAAPELVARARKVIVEVNTLNPSLRGLHDIVTIGKPGTRQPYLITRVDDKIGTDNIPIDSDKIVAIVENADKKDNGRGLSGADEESQAIANHIMQFFEAEVKGGRLPPNLYPLQSGVGNIANAVCGGLVKSNFKNLTSWTEVLQDTLLDLMDADKLNYCTATSLSLSPKGFERFFSKMDFYSKRICLRPQQISNNCEMVRRLGVIAMNTPVEVDIYGHANSTHVEGVRVINGLGGSGDFLRNAHISIMHTPSCRASKTDEFGISCIVPMVTHVDHTEHDLDVIVTEQGLADLRGLNPMARCRQLITKCAHPAYKDLLMDYVKQAESECMKRKAAHQSHMLRNVFKMHQNLSQNGTMRIKNWN
eukprot:TRINITY_DN710_c0_g1_i1.p1 TRINITY_DN710_c0_g1~~TRINITY_DN710_c0_g1_i1.p1  ORF type:complete len:538 (+),score=159.90 TRINITY_DN710_c0_g1_i1:40-1614(+)